MTEVLQFAVLGLGTGAVYVLLAQGIIAVYRGSGIINFAQGALAMLGAYLFVELRDQHGIAFGLAMAFAVLATAVLGALIHIGVMRPLRHASALTRTVATLGVLIVLQGLAQLNWGVEIRFTAPYLPQSTASVGDLVIGVDRLWLLGIAVVITAVMYVISRFTRFGLATTAVAENERAAAAIGWSPDLIAGINWAIGGALAGLAGALVVPATGVQFATTSLLVIPALAVCLLGNFSSFPVTLLAGLALGVAESEVGRYVTTQGASKSIPFFVIVVVLMVRGRALPLRSHLLERLPSLGSGRANRWGVLAAVAGSAALIYFVLDLDDLAAAIVTLCWALMALSVVVLTGYTNQLSLAQLALAGVGAFTAARLVSLSGWPFMLAALAGIVIAILVGVVFALPALRTRGVNLAVVTMGLGLALYLMVFTNTKYTGNGGGLPAGKITLFGLDISPLSHSDRYALFTLGALVGSMWLVSNLRRSRAGRSLVATRTNERAAASLGVNVLATKIYAFGLSAGLAGLGGILLAFRYGTIGLFTFDVFSSVQLVAFTVIGGVGYIGGALLGSSFVAGGLVQTLFGGLLENITGDITDYIVVLGGLGLLAVVLQSPDGLAAALPHRSRRFAARVTRRREVAAPAPRSRPVERVAATPVPTKRIEIRDLTVRFGNVEAVSHVDLEVESGKVTGLIGPNGAGKTTLIDAVTGYVRPATGAITLDGQVVNRWSPYRRARAGVTRSFQSLELFEDLSVLENLRSAADSRNVTSYLTSLVRPDHADLSATTMSIVHDFGLEGDLARKPRELPYGRRRLVAIARSVAAGPSLLLLDEPAAGLAEHEIAELSTLIARLAREWNIGILLIEHHVDFVMSICDEVAVLDFGKMIARGIPDTVRKDPKVRSAYLGDDTEIDDTTSSPVMVEATLERTERPSG